MRLNVSTSRRWAPGFSDPHWLGILVASILGFVFGAWMTQRFQLGRVQSLLALAAGLLIGWFAFLTVCLVGAVVGFFWRGLFQVRQGWKNGKGRKER